MFSGFEGFGVLMARYKDRLSMEIEAPPYPIVSLNGDSRASPWSKREEGPFLRAQEKVSKGRLTRSPFAFRSPARVKKSRVPSAESAGRYSASRVATALNTAGAGASAWALYCFKKVNSGITDCTCVTRLRLRGERGRPVKCSHLRNRSNQVKALL